MNKFPTGKDKGYIRIQSGADCVVPPFLDGHLFGLDISSLLGPFEQLSLDFIEVSLLFIGKRGSRSGAWVINQNDGRLFGRFRGEDGLDVVGLVELL
jgi:hypothetical protein